MIPLWTATTFPSSLTCGCALFSDGSPWVAHLVCPIPHVPGTDSPSFVFSDKTFRRPFALMTSVSPSPSRTAIPAESYPRYYSLERPSRRIGAAWWHPVKPTIPHINSSPLLFLTLYKANYNVKNKHNFIKAKFWSIITQKLQEFKFICKCLQLPYRMAVIS